MTTKLYILCLTNRTEINKSSTWRELKTVENNILSLKSDLSGKLIKLYTDNQNVVQIITKGSMKLDLQEIALHIFHLCLEHYFVRCRMDT